MRSQAFLKSVVICYQLTESVGFWSCVVVFAFILASNKLCCIASTVEPDVEETWKQPFELLLEDYFNQRTVGGGEASGVRH